MSAFGGVVVKKSQIKNKDYVTVNTEIGTTLDIDTKEEFNKQKNYNL